MNNAFKWMVVGLFVAGSASFADGASRSSVDATSRCPNIVLIVADDLGVGDVGCYGSTMINTPNIDKIAEQGVRALQARAAASVCTPSRYAMLTGRYYHRYPMGWNGQALVEVGRPTVATELRRNGYATGYFGKYHGGWGEPFEGRKHRQDIDWNKELSHGVLELGFDTFYGLPFTHNEPPFVFVEDRLVVGLDPDDPIKILMGEDAKKSGKVPFNWGVSIGGKAAHEARPVDRIDFITAQKTAEFITENKDRPFFVNVNFTAPHVPIVPAKEFKGRTELGPYADFIEQMDFCVGQVMAALKENGLDENTLVIFTSDNGAIYHQKEYAAGHRSNKKLLGQKTDAWEGGLAVPFLAKLPGKIKPGTTADLFISLIDMPKTLWRVAGVPAPDGTAEDSLDVWDILTGSAKEQIRKELFVIGITGQALRTDRWAYYPGQGSMGVTSDDVFSWAMQLDQLDSVNSDYENGKLKPDAPKRQLYDLEADPNQTRNVIREYPEMADQLDKRFWEIKNEKKELWK